MPPPGEHGEGRVVERDRWAGVAGLAPGLVDLVADGDEPTVEVQPLAGVVDVGPLDAEDLVAAHPGGGGEPQDREKRWPAAVRRNWRSSSSVHEEPSTFCSARCFGVLAMSATLRATSPRRWASVSAPRMRRWIS
jgi:hypothetical protein